MSQVLEDLVELEINQEIEEIKHMKRKFFKNIVRKAIKNLAFFELIKRKEGRVSENAKGKHIKYEQYNIAYYLSAHEEDITIEDKKWIFKCRVEDINIKGNQRWKYENIYCNSCKENIEETQEHILYCQFLLGQNENVTYIPNYNELFNGNLQEQLYVARLLKENMSKRVSDN